MSETSNPVRSPAVGDLYRAVWRWHFYSGLLVLLFLINLSLTSPLDAVPGTALKYLDPANPGASAEVTVGTEDGKMAVYLDPYSGLVLGAMPDRATLMWTVRTLHSFKYFGTSSRYLIEIAAGWSILLVGTGIYLWWPRGQTGGVVSVRGRPKRRVFWR